MPSLPSQIDTLYRPDDPRRGWAYNVYYVGINIGGFLAPLICGTLGEFYGWHWGFGAAGVGMLTGLMIYILGGKHLPDHVRIARKVVLSAPVAPAGNFRSTFVLLFAVCVAVTVFRGAYEQVGNTVALWADVGINRDISLMSIPMTWRRRAEAGHVDSSMKKMALGALIVAAAYLLLAVVAFAAGDGRASWIWLALFFVIFTLGELYILPTGLGLFARLAPVGYGATTVAAWFFAISAGSLSAGAVGTLWASTSHAQFFAVLTMIAAIAAAMLFALDGAIRRIEAARATESFALSAIQPELV
jgi:POT family proton-dependent oligopeptide transporter